MKSAEITHDAAIRELRALAKKIDAASVAGAFVASLGAPPGLWRAPLMALAAARVVPSHRLRATSSSGRCRTCVLRASQLLRPARDDGLHAPDNFARALTVL